MEKIELNDSERSSIRNILGYLNYSSGDFDPQFAREWDKLFSSFAKKNLEEDIWSSLISFIKRELTLLANENRSFSNPIQAQRTLEIMEKLLVAYREFHKDVLFSQKNSRLFNSFFMARVSRIIVENNPVEFRDSEIPKLVRQLNDFIGYRPIPVLEGDEKHEPNEHEWIAPIPLYYEGVGVAFGEYYNVVKIAIDILRDVDPAVLRAASFNPDKLRELAFDPRPYDFDHPVHNRLNYSFGTWDERCIDEEGFFRRFVVPRMMLDSLMSRPLQEQDPQRRAEYEYESGAVLAGTILMASGVCGGYVQAHDSNVTFSNLAEIIADYRDRFYEQLIVKTPEPLQRRLHEEEQRLFQPFAGVRQYLNQYLAQKRAEQFQRVMLARTYAKMGYFEASKRQAQIIEITASRLLSQIDCYITKAQFILLDSGNAREAASMLPLIEDILFRGIACGAFPDPWFILGFDSQYNLFPSIENGIHDHRLDGLIDLLNEIFDLYSCLMKEAAALGDVELRVELSEKMSNLATWWDQFGSVEVSSVEGFSGFAAWESAQTVSGALAVWNKEGKANGDIAFWKRRIDYFTNPKAFVLLCDTLLEKRDLLSSSALLIYWLSESEKIPLVEGDYSFHTIVFDWFHRVWETPQNDETDAYEKEDSTTSEYSWTLEDYKKRWDATTKFLDSLEANVNSYWEVPTLDLPAEHFARKLEFRTDNPILADLARQLVLSIKYLGKSGQGVPQLSLKGSFRDAARSVDIQNLPTPEGLKQFYYDNRKTFPRFLTFDIFVQILLRELRLPPKTRAYYRTYLLGSSSETFTVTTPGLFSQVEEFANFSPSEENDARLKFLFEAMLAELNVDGVASAQELVDRILEERDQITSSNSEEHKFSEIRDANNDEFDELEPNEYNDESEGQEDDEFPRTITGSDPIFSAAYENMTYRDSADDGNLDDTSDGKSKYQEFGDFEIFARETDRILDRLSFIITTVKLWKSAAVRSPLFIRPVDNELDVETFENEKLRLDNWLKQALMFENGLYQLLDQTSRYRIPQPSGTNDSLMEYDQLRGSKELLLDRVVSAIVDVEDAVLFLKAALRDETTEKYAKPWKRLTLQVFKAIFRKDVKRVKTLWKELIAHLETETLLYIPTSHGGDAKTIVDCKRLQLAVLNLVSYLPRLGLLAETFELIACVQKMEQIRLSSPGSITEYDKLVETGTRSIVGSLTASARSWKSSDQVDDADAQNALLVNFLRESTDVVLKFWLSHSQQIRISTLEAISSEYSWKMVKDFIQNYGSDLFTQNFLAFRNIRAILQQGTSVYLNSLLTMKRDNQELENGEKLVSAILAGTEELERAASFLELILECVGENYNVYVDYNSTTTQSDRGENLYILLDFLRSLATYERINWNLKPLYWTHDSLIRSKNPQAAKLWKTNFKQNSSGLAEKSLQRYNALTRRYGVQLPSVSERIKERFIRPLDVAQMCGLVPDAMTQVHKTGENNSVFAELEKEVDAFLKTPSGNGFEAPEWLNELQDEVFSSRDDAQDAPTESTARSDLLDVVSLLPIQKMTQEEVAEQLSIGLRQVGLMNNKL